MAHVKQTPAKRLTTRLQDEATTTIFTDATDSKSEGVALTPIATSDEVYQAVPLYDGSTGEILAQLPIDLYIHDYLESVGDKMEATQTSYRRALKAFRFWLNIGDTLGDARTVIEKFNKYLATATKSDGELLYKPATAQMYLGTAKRFIDYLSVRRAIPVANLSNIRAPRVTKEFRHGSLSEAQASMLLKRAKECGKRDYALVHLLLTAGLRTIEVHRATIGDIRREGGTTVLYVQGKGHREKDTFVPLSPNTERAISEYLATRKDGDNKLAPLFAGTRGTRAGKPISTLFIRVKVKRLLRSIGIDDSKLTAHSLRHTAVTLALKSGKITVQEAQQFARHAKLDTTMIYAHNLERLKNKCCIYIEQAIDGDYEN